MANHNKEGFKSSPDSPRDSGLDKSIVGKLVSGLISNTPLSKWFGSKESSTPSSTNSLIRKRSELEDDDDDEDDENEPSFTIPPPLKRAKIPSSRNEFPPNSYSAHFFDSPVTVHNSSNNNVNRNIVSISKPFEAFPEPQAGPSGMIPRFHIRQTSDSANAVLNSFSNRDIENGEDESDSDEEEESTSGYSSVPRVVPQTKVELESRGEEDKLKSVSKNRSLFASAHDQNQTRSLFSERSLSPHLNASLSSRRPTFNASTFRSPNFVDRTLSTKRIMSSPFYSGNTTYGGAAAYPRKLTRNLEEGRQNNVRNLIQIKPVDNKISCSENPTLSKTARRILSALEQYSTPISEAKKIPVTPKRHGILSKYIGAAPYSVKDRKKASNTELQVPTIPDLLQMKQKQRLQNSTESVRQIAKASKSALDAQKEEYKLRNDGDKAAKQMKHTNKMKTSVSSVRQKQQDETIPEVNLPKVSLPITTLPKFDFVMAPPQPTKPVNTNNSVTTEPLSKKEKNKEVIIVTKPENNKIAFIFSKPVVISDNFMSISPINCFKFSEPRLCNNKVNGESVKLSEKQTSSAGFKQKNNGENVNSLLTLDKFVTKNKWECPTCLIRNEQEKQKCVACEEPKPQDKTKQSAQTEPALSTSNFDDKFKPSSNTWECPTCLVRNDSDKSNCVACEEPKPQSKTGTSTETKTKQAWPVYNFGDKFKSASDTWECQTCMIRNKNDIVKCAACETPKDSTALAKPVVEDKLKPSFGDKFKPSSDTWECTTCMIRNKKDATKCAACETAKPGQKISKQFNFGTKPTQWECKTCWIKNNVDLRKCAACEMPREDKGEAGNSSCSIKGFGSSFKPKTGDWDCTSCLVRNKSDTDTCVCCEVVRPGCGKSSSIFITETKPISTFNFGIDKAGSSLPFKFGIPTDTQQNNSTSTTQSIFGTQKTVPATTSTIAQTLIFGNPQVTATTTATTSGGFTFGIPPQQHKIEKPEPCSTNPLLKATEKLPEKAQPATAEFSFGVTTSNNLNVKSSETTVVSSGTAISKSDNSQNKPTFEFKPTAAINGDVVKEQIKVSSIGTANVFGKSSTTDNNTNSPTPVFKFKPAEVTVSTTSTTKPAANVLFQFAPTTNKIPETNKRSHEGASESVTNGFSGSAPKFSFASSPSTATTGNDIKKTFVFGPSTSTSKTNEPPSKIAGFSFGQTENKPLNSTGSAPVFNFGPNSVNKSAPAPTFGAPATVQNATGSGFNFSVTSVPAAGFSFQGKSEAVPGFGAAGAKNGTFNFGTNPNNNQKAVFTFGANQSQTAGSFGAQQGGSQPEFNFSAATTAAPPAAVPGGFNFTGAPSFSFTEGSGTTTQPQPQRKIRKALRRTHR